MSHTISTTVSLPFDEAIAVATDALKAHGFGVLTTIDVRQTLKQKIDVDFRPYTILGACNPKMAHRALQAEEEIGAMLPCNVIVQEHAPGRVAVAAVDPAASMQAVENPALAEIAAGVRDSLREVIRDVEARGRG